jgi:hypothetical protein
VHQTQKYIEGNHRSNKKRDLEDDFKISLDDEEEEDDDEDDEKSEN